MIKTFLLNIITTIFFINAFANTIEYIPTDQDGINFKIDKIGTAKLSSEMEFGYISDRALYASFGLETQIFQFSKVVFSINGKSNNVGNSGNYIFKVDFAPIYNSIKTDNKREIIYDKDSQNRDIYGDNYYFDWYKNLGDRIYYTGDIPFIETYIGYESTNRKFLIGRLKSIIGIDDTEVFFKDDAKFSPMGYWLTKDLFSGISYTYNNQFLEISTSLYSGGNPTKGYSNYLGGIETPNLKSNNTISYAGRLKLKYGGLLGKSISGYLYTSYLNNTTGSTWDDAKKDGKRNALAYAHGALIKFDFNNKYINSVDLFFQYNQFISGLSENSCQNDGSSKFKNIKQAGYFVGSEFKTINNKISLGISYEKIDRFDFNLYKIFGYNINNPYKNSKQNSQIYHIKYQINSVLSTSIAYHRIHNPALFASDILDQTVTSESKYLGTSNKIKAVITCTI